MADESTLLTRGAAPVEDTAPPASEPATPAQAEAAPEQKATPAAADDWRPEFLRGEKWTEKYRSAEDALKAFGEAQKLLGKRAEGIIPPGEDAKPEEVEAFNAKLRELRGIPPEDKVAEAYAVQAPEGAPEGYAINPEFLGAFQQLAHKAGVAPAEFKVIAEGYVQMELQAMQAAQEAGTRQAKENEAALVKAWRDDGLVPGEEFSKAQKAAQALGMLGADGTVDHLGKWGDHIPLVRALAEKVYPLIAEGKLKGGAVAQDGPQYTAKEAMSKGRAMKADPRYADPGRRDPDYVREVDAFFHRYGTLMLQRP